MKAVNHAKPVKRSRPAKYKDKRLVAGITLILGSMALGGVGASALTQTVPVVVALKDIPEGTELSKADLQVMDVRLGAASEVYLSDINQIPEGALADRDIGKGEFVARSSVGQVSKSALRPLAIDVADSIAASLEPGATVEVWRSSEEQDDARILVEDAVVRAIDEGGGFSSGNSKVEVLVPAEQVPTILDSLDGTHTLYVIEVPGHFEVVQ